jgi:6-pyruvoyltetrahydropterin/6-carboxytetrahydropterin synthase
MTFEAAHRNPADGPLHGHSYRAGLVVEGAPDAEVGWVIDYGDIKRAFAPYYDKLDHSYLNDVEGLDDASLEGVRGWILERLKPDLPELTDVQLSIVGDLAYKPCILPQNELEELPPRVRFTFECAQALPQLPGGHPCHNLHGHSYRIEAAALDLDSLLAPLERVYNELDHSYLNEIEGLETATCEIMADWLWRRLENEVDGLQAVVVQETDTARCVYRGPQSQ